MLTGNPNDVESLKSFRCRSYFSIKVQLENNDIHRIWICYSDDMRNRPVDSIVEVTRSKMVASVEKYLPYTYYW